MYISSYRISAITKRLQTALNANRKYFNKWKIKLNDDKTEAIIFTRRRPEIINNLCIESHKIIWQDEVKYLGLTLDSKLTFASHIEHLSQRAVAKLIALYPLINRHSSVSKENKLLIYKSLIRPGLTYACPIWSMASKTHYDKLQIAQNKFLRLIGNFRKYTQISEMHRKLDVEYIHSFIKKVSTNYYNLIDEHANPLVRNIKYVNKKYKHKRIMDIVYN